MDKCSQNDSFYKCSRFNNLFESGQVYYLWNSESGALLRLDKEGLAFYLEHIVGKKISVNDFCNCTFLAYINVLIDGGYIVDVNQDELAKVLCRFDRVANSKSPSSLFFTIAPSLGCNFNCEYCFENGRRDAFTMTDVVVSRTIDFVKSRVDASADASKITISWFGGEPLLNLRVIDKMSDEWISYCQMKGLSYVSGMVSNGRYLSPEKFSNLKRDRVNAIQVSMDGMVDLYCKKKRATAQDFSEVVSNVCAAADEFQVTVRINVEQENINEAYALADFLLREHNLDGRIKVYLAYVRRECKTSNEYHGRQAEYNAEFIRFTRYLLSHYSHRSIVFPAISHGLATPCLAIRKHNFCIGPEGELYRCEHDFGNSQAVSGSVFDGHHCSPWEESFYSPLPSKCMDCPILAVCLGGCRHALVHSNETMNCASLITRFCEMKLLEYELRMKKKGGEENGSPYLC